MNLYFLVEGKRTEPILYPKWIAHTFPYLTQVRRIEEVISNSVFLVAARGYPKILQLLEQALTDISNHYVKNKIVIDHFFICLDTDEDGYDKRFHRVQTELEMLRGQVNIPVTLNIHIILQECCIETWLLGHTKMLRRNPQSKILVEFKEFYDVSVTDPEKMGCCPKRHPYSNKTHFHEVYLKEMLKERYPKLTYSKEHPGITTDPEYFQALRERCNKTGHLNSFKKLLDIWETLPRN